MAKAKISKPSAAKANKKKTPEPVKKVVAEVVFPDEVENSPDSPPTIDIPLEEGESDFQQEEEFSKTENLPALLDKKISSKDPLVLYLSEIRKYPLLTKEEENQIARKYFDTKDPLLAQKLVQSNLRFVVKVAAEYSKFGAKMIDLIQEGNVGLMHAVRDFNPHKGARLITYAVWWIRGYIQEYLMRHYSMVRIGTTQNQRKLFYQLRREKQSLDEITEGGNLKLLSSRLAIPEEEIVDMAKRMRGRDVSLDQPLTDEGGNSFVEMQKNSSEESQNLEESLARAEQLDILRRKVKELRPKLSEREKIILDERILNDEPLTLQEIGEKHGITREAVRQMETRVLKKIKDAMTDSE